MYFGSEVWLGVACGHSNEAFVLPSHTRVLPEDSDLA